MGSTNERELQSAIIRGFQTLGVPAPHDSITVQVQWRGDHLIARCRFDALCQDAAMMVQSLTPAVEVGLHMASQRTRAAVREWAEVTVPQDAYALMFVEMAGYASRRAGGERYKTDFVWPKEWPWPPDFALARVERTGGLAGG